MKISALKDLLPRFSTRPSVDAEVCVPSAPQSVAPSYVSLPCPEVRLVTPPAKSVLQERRQQCPSILSTNRVQEHRPDALSATPAPLGSSRASQRADAGIRKCGRRKRGKMGQLYSDYDTAEVHAACLLLDVALSHPQLVGTWVAKDQLCRWYEERTARDGGKAQSWILIGKELKKWTVSERRTHRAKKRTCYRIPPITHALKKRAAIADSWPKPSAEAAYAD